MDLMGKLTVLSDAAKYDAACTSSGAKKRGQPGMTGNATASGICHSFSADGRCITLLKVLQSNACACDCRYCVNRRSSDVPRATFQPRELAELTMGFYRRNYIEGLFLSSAVVGTPDRTCEMMIETLRLLRDEYRFNGYIHCKAIPGADPALIERMGLLSDRMSVNIELPSESSLSRLAPEKSRAGILAPMKQIQGGIVRSKNELQLYRHAPAFAPAGQSTQLIVGASPESDKHILTLSQALYQKFSLKRVFFSAYVPVVGDKLLPSLDTKPPLLREHRLYQADWLLRFYGFDAGELFHDSQTDLDPLLDPKCQWAMNHLDQFPVEVNRAPHETLLRVPGIGVKSAWRIVENRRLGALDFEGLKRIGVVLKRAMFFITCAGRMLPGIKIEPKLIYPALIGGAPAQRYHQISMFEPTSQDQMMSLTGQL